MLWPINGEIFMKLSKEHIGQTFRLKDMEEGGFFLLLAITSKGMFIGEDMERKCI